MAWHYRYVYNLSISKAVAASGLLSSTCLHWGELYLVFLQFLLQLKGQCLLILDLTVLLTNVKLLPEGEAG